MKKTPRIKLNAGWCIPFRISIKEATVSASINVGLPKEGKRALDYRMSANDVAQLIVEHWRKIIRKKTFSHTLNLSLFREIHATKIIEEETSPQKTTIQAFRVSVHAYLFWFRKISISNNLMRWQLSVDNVNLFIAF